MLASQGLQSGCTAQNFSLQHNKENLAVLHTQTHTHTNTHTHNRFIITILEDRRDSKRHNKRLVPQNSSDIIRSDYEAVLILDIVE